ncbi:metal dependent phosphohydrolase [Methanocaldococcus villosus KIN24-T80]|uniref:Metal dependent phosphohydrolase n=1 Tax=Methanocaldococcus villosus KIN24-T80 TaxID=1069083 RepID=N6VPT0_9EURY|nr:HD domain-containing protein [Methanocaldococcus villosus]ENN95905.1 metal dependent phosphohydrolase [Methanocaldococcus villosus KIN24-T80]
MVYNELENLNGVAKKVYNDLLSNKKVNTFLKMSNIMAVGRLGYNDHGKTHAKIVANNAIKMLKILYKRGIKPSFMEDCKGSFEDSVVITLLGAYLHDIGNAIHRDVHHLHSSYLAKDIIEEILMKYYSEEKVYQMLTEILHIIYSHSETIMSLTLEAGVVAVADGTDMTKGRSRVPINKGCYDIHSISSASVEKVIIKEGKEKPIKIEVILSNEAGIFQIQEVLGEKIKWSGIKQYISVYAKVMKEKPVFREISL